MDLKINLTILNSTDVNYKDVFALFVYNLNKSG